MINILCYGDSNTWGYTPLTAMRYDWNTRWPGVMQRILGDGYHVVENGLNGRTTVFDDPIDAERNGRIGFGPILECAAPLDLVIIMLGTNDTKTRFSMDAQSIALGVKSLVSVVQSGDYGADGKPEILIAAPVRIGKGISKTVFGWFFDEASAAKSREFAALYKTVADEAGCHFFNADTIAQTSGDHVHLSAKAHRALGEAFAEKVRAITQR